MHRCAQAAAIRPGRRSHPPSRWTTRASKTPIERSRPPRCVTTTRPNVESQPDHATATQPTPTECDHRPREPTRHPSPDRAMQNTRVHQPDHERLRRELESAAEEARSQAGERRVITGRQAVIGVLAAVPIAAAVIAAVAAARTEPQPATPAAPDGPSAAEPAVPSPAEPSPAEPSPAVPSPAEPAAPPPPSPRPAAPRAPAASSGPDVPPR